MKKVILILMLIYSVCFSQGQYTSSWITEADSGSLQAMYVQSTGIDTSTYYNMKPYLTFKIQVCDTSSGGDSSAVKFYVDRCFDPITKQDWVVEDSLTVSTDSTWTPWIYTEDARSNEQWYRIRAAGQAGNKKLSPTKCEIKATGWEYRR